jgi:ABC-type multidrug transport system fused ATPase/permease subunit
MSAVLPPQELTTWQALRRISRYFRPYTGPILIAFLFVMGNALLALARPWPLKFTFDAVLDVGDGAVQTDLSGTTLWILIGIAASVVAMSFFDGMFTYLHALFINRAGRAVAFDMQSGLFAHVQRLSLQFHSRKQTGDLIARVTNDVKTIRETLVDSVLEVLHSAIFLTGMLAVLFWLDWRLALASLAPAPVLLILIVRFNRDIKKFSRAERKQEGALASIVHETLGTIRLTRIFNREEEANARFRKESAESLQSGFVAKLIEERSSWIVDVLAAVGAATAFGYGVHRTIGGALSPGELLVFLSYVRGFYRPISTGVKHSNKIAKGMTRAERVIEVLDAPEGVTDRPGARPAPPLLGDIAFQHVSFEYEPGARALDRVDLTIPAGEVTALVGPTGAGKTTLVSLITRLYDPTEGAVLIDGVDLRDYTLRSLRSQISVVLQESVLFRATIADNIAYGRERASMDEIVAAARLANAHGFISALENGYDTEVGERGETLSGGQRQRIAIARAMVRNAPILILDEPLTGLDADSAGAVLEALERLVAGKTTLFITHQLYNVQHAHGVVVIEGGRIVQQGAHDELIGADGRYRSLFRAQTRDVPQFRDVTTARS